MADRESPGQQPAGDPTWERLEDQLAWYERRSASCQRLYKRGKLAELIVAATVPVAAASGAPRLLTSVLAAFVVMAEGAQQLYQWHTNWLLYRATAERLKSEQHLFRAGAGPYRVLGATERRSLLAERLEEILGNEHGSWSDRQMDSDPKPLVR